MPKKCVPAEELQAAAAEIADTWTVYRGERQYRIVKASSEKEALRKVGKTATKARPSLPSREWARLHEELGRPCYNRR